MGDVTKGEFYAVDKDIVDRDEAALVCAVVLDILGDDLAKAQVDAYSDYGDEMPDEIKTIQAALGAIGAEQHRRDPGMGVELDLSDPDHARLLQSFAPWSINVDLLGPGAVDMGAFHDCGMWVHFRATVDQAAEATQRLKNVAPVVTLTARRDARREERRSQRASRRAAISDRARNALRRASGQKNGWPTITPPTVPPTGPPRFEPDTDDANPQPGDTRHE